MKKEDVIKKSEAEEQAVLFDWAMRSEGAYPKLKMMLHIPNGGSRHPAEALNLKRQGVKSGVPDIFLPIPINDYHGLFIEMKSEKGKLSGNQKIWIEELEKQGYKCCVCYGFEEAQHAILKYLRIIL